MPGIGITRRALPSLLLWLLALALLAWTLSQLPLQGAISRLHRLSGQDWVLWSLVNVAILYLAVKRWQSLGRALQVRLSLAGLFCLRQAGSAVSFLTPGPHFGGEPLQIYWLHRHFDTPVHRAFAMLGLDRFVETGTNVAVLLAGVLMLLATAILPAREWLVVIAILAGVLCALLISAALVLRHPDWLAQRVSVLMPRSRVGPGTESVDDPAGRARRDLGEGWRALVDLLKTGLQQHRSILWLALALSLAGWCALLAELALLLHVSGLTPSPMDLVLIMVGMRLAMLLPVPGGIGTIEASLLWSFQHLGFPVSAAVGLIALIRLRDVLVLLVGMGCLYSFQRGSSQRGAVLAE